MNEFLGKIHFWVTFISLNYVFFNMIVVGYAGQHHACLTRLFMILSNR